MTRRYSLWDTRIGSQLGRFSTEAEALAFVRSMLETYPRDQLEALSLNWRDELGRVGDAQVGEDLIARAETGAAKRAPAKIRSGNVVRARPTTFKSGTEMRIAAAKERKSRKSVAS